MFGLLERDLKYIKLALEKFERISNHKLKEHIDAEGKPIYKKKI